MKKKGIRDETMEDIENFIADLDRKQKEYFDENKRLALTRIYKVRAMMYKKKLTYSWELEMSKQMIKKVLRYGCLFASQIHWLEKWEEELGISGDE